MLIKGKLLKNQCKGDKMCSCDCLSSLVEKVNLEFTPLILGRF